jgi:3-oxoadipyl-CoA thiolase
MSTPQAFIVGPLRTPIGRYAGALSEVRPDDLLALVFRAVLDKSKLDPGRLDEVIAGCANQAGEDNRNVARMAALLAGVPHSVPGVTVNRLCASGLEAVNLGYRAILAGEADLVLAGGVESMSRAPYSVPKNATGKALFGNLTAWDTALGWRYPNPKLEALFPLEVMGATAENLAESHNISREAQDRFALRSHQRACQASAAGVFDRELVPVPLPVAKGEPVRVTKDEGPRADTSLEALGRLKPAFRQGGTVTAGNSSTLNDGAAAMLVASERALREHGLTPMARIVATGTAGVDPRVMGIGPVPATGRALERAGWALGSIDRVELNEAFAAQSLAVIGDLGLDPDRVNVRGGGIALGHPLGMSGARILVTLLHTLEDEGLQRGLATLCVGVGQGVTTLVER